jgi:hypothetical protein
VVLTPRNRFIVPSCPSFFKIKYILIVQGGFALALLVCIYHVFIKLTPSLSSFWSKSRILGCSYEFSGFFRFLGADLPWNLSSLMGPKTGCGFSIFCSYCKDNCDKFQTVYRLELKSEIPYDHF